MSIFNFTNKLVTVNGGVKPEKALEEILKGITAKDLHYILGDRIVKLTDVDDLIKYNLPKGSLVFKTRVYNDEDWSKSVDPNFEEYNYLAVITPSSYKDRLSDYYGYGIDVRSLLFVGNFSDPVWEAEEYFNNERYTGSLNLSCAHIHRLAIALGFISLDIILKDGEKDKRIAYLIDKYYDETIYKTKMLVRGRQLDVLEEIYQDWKKYLKDNIKSLIGQSEDAKQSRCKCRQEKQWLE